MIEDYGEYSEEYARYEERKQKEAENEARKQERRDAASAKKAEERKKKYTEAKESGKIAEAKQKKDDLVEDLNNFIDQKKNESTLRFQGYELAFEVVLTPLGAMEVEDVITSVTDFM